MTVTIRDVAKKANVSVGTVSRYLNGYELKEKNRINIENAIKELGFKENIIAKGLKNNRSMTIGVVIGNLTDIFSTSIVTSIERTVEQDNYSIILCNYEGDEKRLIHKLNFLKDRSVDGLIIFNGKKAIHVLKAYLELNIPVVIMDENIPGLETDFVTVDNSGASFRAVERLIHFNHENIGIICGSLGSNVTEERLHGYIEALKTYHLPIENTMIRYGNYSSQGGYHAMMALMQQEKPPTAVYITNYYMTLGAFMAINEMNIRVPDQLSVIGFDYFEFTDVIKPALTVIEQPTDKIGEAAGKMILKRIKGDYSNFPEKIQLSTRLILKDSIADPC